MAKKPVPGKAQQRPQPRPQTAAKAASAATQSSEPAGWLTFALVALAITALCYLPSLSNGLVNWDDDPNITENPNLQRINEDGLAKAIPAIFDVDKGAVIGNYNPLPILTFVAMIAGIVGGGYAFKKWSKTQQGIVALDKFVLNIEEYGNTSSASIPIALDEAVRDGRIRPGQNILLCALGAGISWGAAIIRM